MTRAEWIAFGTFEALLGVACIRAWQLRGNRTNRLVDVRNWREHYDYAWRDVRGLALVRLAPRRPPIVALQLRTGALRRVEALHALGSIEQKGLARPLKREGITRT
jgi:hypothetical protein